MKTYLAKEEKNKRAVLFDANGEVLGRLSVKIANALRGKDCVKYTPHVDTGAVVIVVNAAKVKLTGNKEETKIYQSYSGFRSGLKEIPAKVVREKKPERLVRDAVWGMLPHGRLGRAQFKRLRVYADENHPHASQQPQKAN
jgi:large subunit ribosomal protein L13